MSAAQNRFKQARTPLGGSEYTPVTNVGVRMSAAQNRFKQARTPLGGSEYMPVTNVGVQ